MQIPHLSSMVLPKIVIPLFASFNLGGNQIGNEGCKYLSQSKWAYLKELSLNQNIISSEGVKHLCKANWS